MSGDGKDAGQETDRGTLAHEICSSSAAMSGDGKDAGQETADEVHPPIPCPLVKPKTEELDREDDRGTELRSHGSPEKVPEACSIKRRKKSRLMSADFYDDDDDSSDRGGSLTNEWFKMRTFDASGDAAVLQGGAAEPGNKGSGPGTSCWPLPWGSKKDSKN